jgi:hypothetical protein
MDKSENKHDDFILSANVPSHVYWRVSFTHLGQECRGQCNLQIRKHVKRVPTRNHCIENGLPINYWDWRAVSRQLNSSVKGSF